MPRPAYIQTSVSASEECSLSGLLASMLFECFSKYVCYLCNKSKNTNTHKANHRAKGERNTAYGVITPPGLRREGKSPRSSCSLGSGGSGDPDGAGTQRLPSTLCGLQVCFYLGKWQHPFLNAWIFPNNYSK